MPDVNPEILKMFGFWGSLLILKLMMMVPLTGRQRFKKKIFSNPEDLNFKGSSKVSFNDPDIERVRRAHLNDLENIPAWFIITYLWLTTNPAVWLAKLLIRTFVLARVGHTVSYAILPQQPMRAISFFIGFIIMGYEAITTLIHYT